MLRLVVACYDFLQINMFLRKETDFLDGNSYIDKNSTTQQKFPDCGDKKKDV